MNGANKAIEDVYSIRLGGELFYVNYSKINQHEMLPDFEKSISFSNDKSTSIASTKFLGNTLTSISFICSSIIAHSLAAGDCPTKFKATLVLTFSPLVIAKKSICKKSPEIGSF